MDPENYKFIVSRDVVFDEISSYYSPKRTTSDQNLHLSETTILPMLAKASNGSSSLQGSMSCERRSTSCQMRLSNLFKMLLQSNHQTQQIKCQGKVSINQSVIEIKTLLLLTHAIL